MKTAISVPDTVFRSADALAKNLGVSRSELYSTAVAEFVARHRSRQVTARLDAVYGEEESSLPRDVAAAQLRTVGEGDW